MSETPEDCNCGSCQEWRPQNGPMNPDLKGPWLEALRSGEYLQGPGALRRDSAAGVSFCCLGVLSEVAVAAGKVVFTPMTGYKAPGDAYHCDAMPSSEMNRVFGITDGTAGALAGMNDTDGKSFAEIADWVEENL